MPDINIRVKNKIATADRTIYVCGNSDYVAAFDFDSEWDAYETKTARFSFGGQYTDVVFTGNQCEIPVITNTFSFNVGVFAGDLHTTTSAYISCRKSILCGTGTPAAPTEDVYSQIMELLNRDEWTKVAEITAEGNVNKLVATFPACDAIHVDFQFGGVADDLGTIYLIPNAKESPYTGEYRGVAGWVTTSSSVKRGWLTIDIDTRMTTNLYAKQAIHTREEGSLGTEIAPGQTMNCTIGATSTLSQSIIDVYYLKSNPFDEGITTFTAIGAGMVKGTTMYIYGRVKHDG